MKKSCGNCETEMKFLKREDIQLGKTGLFLGDLPNLLAGALDVEIWCCPQCGKLDFYLAQLDLEIDDCGAISQIECEQCGAAYDLDYPKCPCCGAKNAKW